MPVPLFFLGWYSVNGLSFDRIRAAAKLLKLLPVQCEFVKAAHLAKEVIDLLPIISSRSLDLEHRKFILSKFAGVAATACSLCLEIEEPN